MPMSGIMGYSVTGLMGVAVAMTALLWYLSRFLLYKIRVNRMMKAVQVVKGGVPVFGHMFFLIGKNIRDAGDMYDVMEELLPTLETDQRFWVFNYHFFAAIQVETIEKILSSADTVEKSYIYSFFSQLFDGIFIASTSKWKKLRKRLNTTFNPKFFPSYLEKMNRETGICVDLLRTRRVGKNGAADINVLSTLSKYFFDLTTSTHFGVRTATQLSQQTTVAEEISRCTEMVFKRAISPWFYPGFIYNRTNLFRTIEEALSPHIPFLENLVTESAEVQKRLDETGNRLGWKCYPQLCAQVHHELGLDTSPSVLGNAVTDVLVAGTDTASVAVSHLLYQLGKNPEYQDIAYKEVLQVLRTHEPTSTENPPTDLRTFIKTNGSWNEDWGDKKDGEYDVGKDRDVPDTARHFWTKTQLDRLQYLEMLIKESLRLCAPPIIVRHLRSNFKIDNYTIPKGTNVGIGIRSLHMNPDYWENPDTFFPDHFQQEAVKKRPKCSYLPFSYGPRDCPGKVFAMYAMKCVLAEILRHFKVENDGSDRPVNYKVVFMIEQTHGYPVRLTPRK